MQLVIKYSLIFIVGLIGLVFSFQIYKENLGDKVNQYKKSGGILIITYFFVTYMNRKISNDIFNQKEIINFLLLIMILLTIILKYFFKLDKIKGERTEKVINIFLPMLTLILFIINTLIK